MSTTSEQFVLPLPVHTARGRDDFFVAPCNAFALQTLENWHEWPDLKLALTGPEGSGKTHLAHVWAEQTGAVVVDATTLDVTLLQDAPAIVVEGGDRILANPAAQENLFHLHNAMNASKRPLLITGRAAPARWGLELPDLVSRLSAIQVARLDPPDDALLGMILVKLFADRQVAVGPDLIAYLVKRVGRSYQAVINTVSQLDNAAFSRKKPLTVRLAAQILAGR